jgi:hypothetical protein
VHYGHGLARHLEAHVDFSALDNRIRALETLSTRMRLVKGANSRTGHHVDRDRLSLLSELEGLAHEVTLLKEDALAVGDHRFALACVREYCRILETIGRLRGELEGKGSTNILHVSLDADTGRRIAETYLARRKELENE